MEAEGGTVEGPVGWSFQSLSREKMKSWDGSTERESGREFWVAEKSGRNEEEECVSAFGKGAKEGYHN